MDFLFVIAEPMDNESIPRVMAHVMAPGYNGESFMRCGAFDVRED